VAKDNIDVSDIDQDQKDSMTSNDRVPDLAKNFLSIFNRMSYNNEYYGIQLFHMIVGEALKGKRIPIGPSHVDTRIHPFLIQDSGTGKSAPLDLVNDLCSDLGIRFKSLDEATDAALLGTVEKEEYTDDEGNTQQRWTIEEGVLANADIVHYDEGSNLIQSNGHNENSVKYFQSALNPIGSTQAKITKEMAHGDEIVIRPDCSLYLTSYMPRGIEDAVVETGLLQRMTTFPRDVDLNLRRRNAHRHADMAGRDISVQAEYDDILSKLREIQNFYMGEDEEDEGHDIEINDQMRKLFKSRIENLFGMIENASRGNRKVLATFLPRLQNQMYILAYHSAACDMRTTMNHKDIWYASSTIQYIFRHLITWIEMSMDMSRKTGIDKEKHYLKKLFRNWNNLFEEYQDSNCYVSRNRLKKTLPDLFSVTESTAMKYVKIFDEDRNWLKSQTKSQTDYYAPNNVQAPFQVNS
jgi:hypothetical protein